MRVSHSPLCTSHCQQGRASPCRSRQHLHEISEEGFRDRRAKGCTEGFQQLQGR